MELQEWLQFLEHRENSYRNTVIMILTVGLSFAALFISLAAIFNVLLLIPAILSAITGMSASKKWRDETIRAKKLLDEIFEGKIQDVAEIKGRWFDIK